MVSLYHIQRVHASTWGGSTTAADLESARRAYEQKDYAVAAPLFLDLAKERSEEAQLAIGRMYMMGQGAQFDRTEAMKWLSGRGLARPTAQFFLGAMYLLPQTDVSEGLKWLQLAARENQLFYQNELQAARAQMTADQIAKANASAAQWKPALGAGAPSKP